MYEDHYGFVEKPFSLTPDPKYLYRSRSHSDAHDLLQYAIRRREGFAVLTGDIGTGKTTLCRAVLEELERKTFTALVLNPFLSEEDLLRLILQEFGVVSRTEMRRGRLAGVSKQQLVETLNDFLLSLLPLEASAVLVIDEAQHLPVAVLEQLRMLSNLETNDAKLLQIVLVGQLELQDVLRTPDLRQLDQRISIRCELKPLTRDEVAAYVAHRLAVAGGGLVRFTPRAIDRIAHYSHGIPRLVNLVCDRALLAAFASHSEVVLPAMVTRGAASLDLRRSASRLLPLTRFARRLSVPAAAALTAAVGAVAVVNFTPARAVPSPGAPAVRLEERVSSDQTIEPTSGARTTGETAGRVALRGRVEGVVGGAPVLGSEPYAILIGSFWSVSTVERLRRQLDQLGFPTFVIEEDQGVRGSLRQLLVGRFANASDALTAELRLRGFPEFGNARLVVSTLEESGR